MCSFCCDCRLSRAGIFPRRRHRKRQAIHQSSAANFDARRKLSCPEHMKRPLMGLAIVYAAGIWLGSIVHGAVPVLMGVVAVSLVGFFTFRRIAFLFCAVFVAGTLAYQFATTDSSSLDITSSVE